MLIVVRHAEAGTKGSWAGPDLRRPLSAEGRDQAEVASLFVHGEAGNAVLCTHGELIGRLFARLVPAGLAVDEPLRWPKGSAWPLWRTQHRLHARFPALLALDRRTYAS